MNIRFSHIFLSSLLLTSQVSLAGATPGQCFNLQIIAVKSPKQVDNSGNRIFVQADGSSDIYLQQGPFAVIDGNATNANGGLFQLPYPGSYSIWVRPVGKPGTSLKSTTCVDVLESGVTTRYCSTESVLQTRSKGKSSFSDVTKQMTSLVYDFDNDPSTPATRVNIFDDLDALLGATVQETYLWQMDSVGKAHLQMRLCYQ